MGEYVAGVFCDVVYQLGVIPRQCQKVLMLLMYALSIDSILIGFVFPSNTEFSQDVKKLGVIEFKRNSAFSGFPFLGTFDYWSVAMVVPEVCS